MKRNHASKVPSERNENSENLQKRKTNWMQLIAVISVSTMSIGAGAFEMWIFPALIHIMNDKFKFKVTSTQISWIVSLFNVGEIIGFLVHPFLINRIGRKYTLLASALPQLLGSVLVFIAENVETLCAAQIVGGIGFGAGSVVQNFYISEIAEKHVRGRLGSLPALGLLIGRISIIYAGPFASNNNGMHLTILIFPIIFMVTFIFMPESPYFYLQRNEDEKALNVLSKLRRNKDSKSLEPEIRRIKETIIEDEQNKKFVLRNLIENKRHRKALIIVAILKIAVAFSGARFIATYLQVFSNTGLIFGLQFIMLIVSPILVILIIPIITLVDFLGRRLMILLSSIACSVSLLIIGFFFSSNDITLLSWLPFIALLVLDIGCIALLATADVLSVELFSLQVKSTAIAVLFFASQLLEFLIKFTFENITRSIGIHGILWIYCVLCFSLSLTGYLIMPETKGKNLEEIQLLLD